MNLTNTSKFNSFKMSNKNRNNHIITNDKFNTDIDLVKVNKKNNFESYNNLHLNKNYYIDNKDDNQESVNYLQTTASSNKQNTPRKNKLNTSNSPKKNNLLSTTSTFAAKKTFLLNKTSNISIESNPLVLENLKKHFENPEEYLNEDFENMIIVGKKSIKPRMKDVILKNNNIQKSNKILESKNMRSTGKMASRKNSRMNTLTEEKQIMNSSIKSFLKPKTSNVNGDRNFSPNQFKISRTNSQSSSNKNNTNSFIKRSDIHKETKKNFLFSTKNVKEDKNYIVVDEKAINEYFKDILDKKDSCKIKIDNDEFGYNCYAKNKNEMKRILNSQENRLLSFEKKTNMSNKIAAVINKKVKRDNLLMETSIEQFRLKKEMIDKREAELNSTNMGCTNKWVTKLREYELNKGYLNNQRINSFNNINNLKNKEVKSKNLKYATLIEENLYTNTNLPVLKSNKNNSKERMENAIDEFNITKNGDKCDSKTPVSLNFKQYKTVNFGSNNNPIYAQVVENKENLEIEKIVTNNEKIIGNTINQVSNNHVNMNTQTQTEISNENNKYKFISLNNRTNYTNFLKTNYFSSTSGSRFEINSVENVQTSELKNLKTNYEEMFLQTLSCMTNNTTATGFKNKENIQFKLNKRNQRFLCKVDEKIIQNTCSNISSKMINVENVNVDSKLIFDLQAKKNFNLYNNLMIEEEKVNQKLSDLKLKGCNLALVEKENALKIPGKKVLYKNTYKGMFDEEILLSDFDKII